MREALYAGVALWYLHARGYDLVGLLPAPTGYGTLAGLALYAASVLARWAIDATVKSAHSAPQPIEQMLANAAISFVPVVAMSVVNGLYEEVFLLGYLQRALERSASHLPSAPRSWCASRTTSIKAPSAPLRRLRSA